MSYLGQILRENALIFFAFARLNMDGARSVIIEEIVLNLTCQSKLQYV